MRSVWLTTVWNIDWPTTSGESNQKAELITILNNMKDANFNTIMLQVRARGDLIYPSSIEPFAKSITGMLGQNPGWDPLQFAINEAHSRGMELHAWFVVYNVYPGSASPPSTSPQHVANAHPSWVTDHTENSNTNQWLDPGIPAVKNYLVSIIEEMVTNYELDGVHFDYIRYPGSDFNDNSTYATYGGGQNLADWRRENINQFVYEAYDAIQTIRPMCKLGSAPIGIYENVQNGSGWQGYHDIYQDSRDWIQQGKHDYLCPQIYWDLGSNPKFDVVLDTWVNSAYGKHIYPGIATYRMSPAFQEDVFNKWWVGPSNNSRFNWSASEIQNQINYARSTSAKGQIYFSARDIYNNVKSIHTLLKNNQYEYPANIPSMSWQDNVAANPPTNLQITQTGPASFNLNWTASSTASDGDNAKYYNVYQSATSPVDISDMTNVVAFQVMNGTSTTIDFQTAPTQPVYFTVTAYDKGYNESTASNEVNTDELSGDLTVDADEVIAQEGGQIAVPIRAISGFTDINSMQFTIEYDVTKLTYLQPQSYNLNYLDTGDFFNPQAGIITLSWFDTDLDGETKADGSVLFEVLFDVIGTDGEFSDIDLTGSVTAIEFTDVNFNVLSATLTSGKVDIVASADAIISGNVHTENGSNVKTATIDPDCGTATTTNTSGDYSLTLPTNSACTVTPEKSNDVLLANGVTTLDIVLIQRHILNTQLLGSPYKMIAADVNLNNEITTLDLVLIQQLILGNSSSFPNGRLWNFVPTDYVFPNPQNPWGFDTDRNYVNTSTLSGQDLIGIKLGDVNGSWDAGVD